MPEIPSITPTEVKKLTMGIAEATIKAAVACQVNIIGTCHIGAEDKPAMFCSYSANQQGSFVIWFLHQGMYHLMSLVNQSDGPAFKSVLAMPMQEEERFRDEMLKLTSELNIALC